MFKEFSKDCYPKGEPIVILQPDNRYAWVSRYTYYPAINDEIKMEIPDSYPEYYPKGSKWCYEYEIIEEYFKEHGYKSVYS